MLPPASPPSTAEKTKKSLPVLLEDPVRRRYKAILTVSFIATSGLYIVVDVIFQVISNRVFAKFYDLFRSRALSPRAISPQHLLRISHRWHSHFLVTSNNFTPSFFPSLQHLLQLAESAHEANLATALYLLIFAQQIINPCIFLYSEFRAK